jgi:hypothetical protein
MDYSKAISRWLLPCLLAGALSGAACVKAPETTLGAAVEQGGVSVTVQSVEAAYIDLEGAEGAAQTTEPVLLVRLALNNGSPAALRYDINWSTTATTQAQSPLLYIDQGPDVPLSPANNVPIVRLGTMEWPGDPVSEPQSVEPGATMQDVLLFEVPSGGTSGLVLSLPPSMFGPEVKTPAYVRIPWTAQDPAPPAPVGLGETYEGAGFTFTLASTEQTYLRLQSPTAPRGGFTSSPVLKLNFVVTNSGEEPLVYLPPEANRSLHAPTLTDPDGATINRVQLPSGSSAPGHVNERTTIGPGESFNAAFLFEQPPASIDNLVLQLPGKRFGSTGLVRVAFDYAMQSVAVPAELTPQAAEGSGEAAP